MQGGNVQCKGNGRRSARPKFEPRRSRNAGPNRYIFRLGYFKGSGESKLTLQFVVSGNFRLGFNLKGRIIMKPLYNLKEKWLVC